jgi:hypothetical protein
MSTTALLQRGDQFRRRRIGQTLLNPAIGALVHADGDPVEQTGERKRREQILQLASAIIAR